ncbi:hypothetical protein DFH11DRAFT_1629986 [Phellopilus nigrolimitatus]|nr:hypothetical protein DFH11DRAFT_1643063 [Phellopilus nigrolimitatus]KAH8108976.1 hypothetical protein DFH11DRAFT_1629986 [Phellopilus nigrolimitatus]
MAYVKFVVRRSLLVLPGMMSANCTTSSLELFSDFEQWVAIAANCIRREASCLVASSRMQSLGTAIPLRLQH